MMGNLRIQRRNEPEPIYVTPTGGTFGSGDAGQPPQLSDYLGVLFRHKWLILGLVVAMCLLGLAYYWLKTPVYEAQSSLQIQPASPQVVPNQMGSDAAAEKDTFYETQYNIIRSRSVASAVVANLSPHEKDVLLDQPSLLDNLIPGGDQKTPPSSPERRHEALIRAIENGLIVTGVRDSAIVLLTFHAVDPEVAAHVTNLVAQSYIGLQEQAHAQQARQANQWLNGQLHKLRADLTKSQEGLEQFKQQHGLLSTQDLTQLKSERLSTVTQQLLQAQADLQKAEVQYKQTQEALQHGGATSMAPVLNDPVVQQLKLRQAQQRSEVRNLGATYGARAPEMQAAQARLQQITSQLHAEVSKAVDSIDQQYQSAKARLGKLKEMSQNISSNVREQSSVEFQLAKLEREVQTNRELYQTFLSRVKETGLASQMTLTNIQIVDRAVAPHSPFAPSLKRVLGLALLVSLFLGVVLSFLRENMQRTVRSPMELENRLQRPSLGVLPQVAKGRKGPALLREVALEPLSPYTEAMGEIRSRLIASGHADRPQVIMVTSALSGEGKSTLSSNLAYAYSQLGRTLLLDADLRKSSLESLGNELGFTDYVSAGADSRLCIAQDMTSDNLFIMGRGRVRVNPMAFLSSERVKKTLERLRQQFDTIIIDTAPVLAVSDAVIIGRHADGAVVSVKANDTPFDVVREAVRRLESSRVEVLGVTLSQANPKDMARYGSYYGYGYGHNYGET